MKDSGKNRYKRNLESGCKGEKEKDIKRATRGVAFLKEG